MLIQISTASIVFAQEQKEAENNQPTPKGNAGNKAPKTSSPLVDLIKSNQNDKAKMRSMDWNTSKYKKKNSKETEQEDTNDKEITPDENEELTESQKIWKHYNDLAKRKKSEKAKKKSSKDTDKPEKEEKEESSEAKNNKNETNSDKNETKDEEKQSSSGELTDILQRYKATQKSQGPMNSRSFGSID